MNGFRILALMCTNLVFSACCYQLDFQAPASTVLFDPGFEIDGDYEFWLDDVLVLEGTLDRDDVEGWIPLGSDPFNHPQARIDRTGEFPRLQGLTLDFGQPDVQDIEIIREGEEVGLGVIRWECNTRRAKPGMCGTTQSKSCRATLPVGDI